VRPSNTEPLLRLNLESATSRGDISNSKQEIINFRKIVRPERAVLRDLERTKQRYLAEDLEVYFDDIVDAPSASGTCSRTTRRSSRRSRDERVGARPPVQRRAVHPHGVHHRLPAGHVDREHLGDERGPTRGGEPPSADTTVFWIIVGSMVALLAGLLVFFRRRGWL
jgi:magnesium transporter